VQAQKGSLLRINTDAAARHWTRSITAAGDGQHLWNRRGRWLTVTLLADEIMRVERQEVSVPFPPSHRPGWDLFVRIAGVLTFLIAIGCFVELARSAPKGRYLPLENMIMEAMRPNGQPLGQLATAAMVRDITALGSAVVLTILTLLILGYLWMTRRYRTAGLIAFATAGGQLLNLFLKHEFARERPDAVLHLVQVSSSSFPSGHTMESSIFYLTIGALLARMATRRREKSYFIASALLLTFLIGASRVYLGVHYPTDVLAGWSAGTAWALLCWFVADWLGRHGKLRAETGEPATA
jgi:undecaprenyl-diphosphatase